MCIATRDVHGTSFLPIGPDRDARHLGPSPRRSPRLREAAGLPKEPTGVVANDSDGVIAKVKNAVSGT